MFAAAAAELFTLQSLPVPASQKIFMNSCVLVRLNKWKACGCPCF